MKKATWFIVFGLLINSALADYNSINSSFITYTIYDEFWVRILGSVIAVFGVYCFWVAVVIHSETKRRDNIEKDKRESEPLV